MNEDEKRMFDKYIKPQIGAFKRLKLKIIMRFKSSKRVKTLKDMEYLDYNFIIKIFGLMMFLAFIQILGNLIYDIYIWFYPQTIIEPPTYPYFIPIMVGLVGKGNRPGGEFGKRLRDRFIEIGTHPKLGINMQSFFNFQGTAVKPVCECGTYIYDRSYWIGHRGPLCYRCYLRGDKK